MTREEAIQYLIKPVATSTETGEEKQKEFEAYNMAIKALEDIERWRTWSHTYDNLISRQDAVNEIHKYFVEEIDKTPVAKDEDGDEVYTDMPTVNSLLACNKELSKRIKTLPCRLTEYKTFCGVPIEEAVRVMQEYNAEPKTGEWKTDTVYAGIRFYRCDQCDFRQSEKSRYCPNCGSRMRGEEE